MAITTRDGLIAAVAAGQELDFVKAGVTWVAGRYASLFRLAGRPGAAASPTTAAGNTCSSATVGALPFTNPATGLSYLAQLACSTSQAGSLTIYDRLVETATLSGTVTTAQTVNSVALPARAAGGLGVAIWLEVHTALGTATSAGTVSYTNSDGVTGRTGTVIGGVPGSAAAGTMIPVALQAGDRGVQSVQTITLATSTLTAGSFGVTLLQRIAEIPLQTNLSAVLSWADLGLPQVKNDACLAFMVLAATTTTPTVVGSALVAQG